MIDFFFYLVKMAACSGIFYLFYLLFLRNKVFNQWNRFFLLSSVIISILIPFCHFSITTSRVESEAKPIHVLQAVQSANEYFDDLAAVSGTHASGNVVILLSYVFISCVLFFLFLMSISKVVTIILRNPIQNIGKIRVVHSQAPGTPFTFLHYIFWNNHIEFNSINGQRVFLHEVIHVREKHTLDRLFIQLVLVVFWINPFFWLIHKELKIIHEFIADKKSVAKHGIDQFAAMILQLVYPHKFNTITSHFFQSSIKRRIQMLTRINYPRINYFTRLLSIAIVACTVLAFTVSTKPGKSTLHLKKQITVVIDAGHGKMQSGFSGARHEDVYEDEIVLELANKVKSLNHDENIKILLTRNSDEIVALKERVEFARNNKADVFISLHVAANDPNIAQQRHNGFEIFVPKDQPAYQKESEILGSILLQEFNDVYYTYPKLLKPTTGIWVLNKNVCTSVLIECGYITDTADRNFITDEKNQDMIAQKILSTIARFAIESHK
jgi:N-acetylmuramoyl-L-alanine amidase